MGLVSLRQWGLVIASPVELPSVTDYCRVHLPIIFIKDCYQMKCSPQLDRSGYTANTKRGWGALAQSAGVEDLHGVEDLLAGRKGWFHQYVNTQLWLCEGLEHHAGWLGPGSRGGIARPRDQEGHGHRPGNCLDE